ncbi:MULTISPECIES: hypothetical protein [Brevibacterium]|nr:MULTISPECIES: hypothetical protein [Brevibacterium]
MNDPIAEAGRPEKVAPPRRSSLGPVSVTNGGVTEITAPRTENPSAA